MNLITHSLLPVVLKQSVELRQARMPAYRQQLRGWLAIAVFAALPDVLHPHLSLGARYNSYSHQWPMTALVVVSCFGAYLVWRRRRDFAGVALWCGAAYALHVGGDIASGGLDFFGTGEALGAYWIPPEAWPVCDLVLLVGFALMHRRIRVRQGLAPSPITALRQWIGREPPTH